MMYLFSDNGLRFLESVCFVRTLFAFDFDGTLTKIVKNSDEAKITKTTLKLLQRLGELAPVAVISGRSLNDLKKKIDPFPGYLIGNHGLEGIHSHDQKLELFRQTCEKWKQHLTHTLIEAHVRPDGIEIEDKIYSIAIHYRKSRAKRQAKTKILDTLTQLIPSARIILGKCVVNIVPTGAPHKGVALLELMLKSDTKSALYIGDDDTDEDIFTLPNSRIFTIRVGKKKSSEAKFYLKGQAEVNFLLEKLLYFLQQEKRGVSVHELSRTS